MPENTSIEESIKALIDESVDSELVFEKTQQFIRLDKSDKYNRGLQYVAPTEDPTGAIRFSEIGAPVSPGDDSRQGGGLYDYNIDIIGTYGDRWTAVLGQRPFHHVKAVADDPQSEDDREAARQAEIAKLWLHTKWDAPIRNLEIAMTTWEAGTAWIYTPYVVDKKLFGTSSEPVVEEREVEIEPGGYRCISCGVKSPELVDDELTATAVCPNCQYPSDINAYEEPETANVPEIVSFTEYENGGVACHVCDGFTVTVHFYSTDEGSLPVLLYEYEEHEGTLLRMFPELRDMMKSEGGFEVDGRDGFGEEGITTRSSRESLLGHPRGQQERRWTFSRYWLSPDTVELIQDDANRKKVLSDYPDGLKVTMVGGRILLKRLENESVADVWTPIKPKPKKFLYQDPVCFAGLGHQDMRNDMWNIGVEHMERGTPTHIADAGLLDVDALNERPFIPQEIIETKGQSGNLEGKIKTLPTARFPAQLIPLVDGAEKAFQDKVQLPPQVWGGSTGNTRRTAEQFRLELTQGLMPLGVPGMLMTRGWVSATKKAVKQLEKHAPKNMGVTFSVNGKPQSAMLDFAALRDGNYHFEGFAGLPQTFAERRDELNSLLRENPDLAAKMGVHQPSNVGKIKDYVGLHDLDVPGEDVRQKTMDAIHQLLQDGQQGAGPIPEQMPDGSIQMMPSVPPEGFVDDHLVIAQLVREWCISEVGRKAKQENPQGYENVKAHGVAQELMGGQMAPAPAPPGEEPAPGESAEESPSPGPAEQPSAVPNQPPPLAMPAGTN